MTTTLIVVVDEDAMVRALFADMFLDEGYRTILCSNVNEGFDCACRLQPNLIVLDLWIGCPEAGWKLIQSLRDDVRTTMIPILVCSSDSESLTTHEAQLRNWGYGMSAKPFDVDSLLVQVRSLTPPFEHWVGECELFAGLL